jgi:SAM-dependent methyltransferase
MSDRLASRAWTSLRLRAADASDRVRGRHDPLVPPRRANFVGNSDFVATGDQFAELFRRHAGLAASDRVLDVGCGLGRMARPLTRVLSPPAGSYDGFDVVADAITWCRRHYAGTSVPFRFAHLDLFNAEYNPHGRGRADDVRFPYPDGTFDLVLATSVFTHLLSADARRYLSEIARVLAPGGRLFATWFLLDDDLDGAHPPPMISFAHRVGDAAVADPDAPAAAVAYPRAWVQSHSQDAGLDITAVIRGSWATPGGPTPQDIVTAGRRADGRGG